MKKSKSQEPDKKLWNEVSKALTKLSKDDEWKVVPRDAEKDYYDLYNEHDS